MVRLESAGKGLFQFPLQCVQECSGRWFRVGRTECQGALRTCILHTRQVEQIQERENTVPYLIYSGQRCWHCSQRTGKDFPPVLPSSPKRTLQIGNRHRSKPQQSNHRNASWDSVGRECTRIRAVFNVCHTYRQEPFLRRRNYRIDR